MRKLVTDDMFLLSEIIDKMELDIDVKGKGQEELGAEIIFGLLRKAHRAKDEIKQLVASLLEKPVEDVSNMPVAELVDIIGKALQEDGVVGFIKSAASSPSQSATPSSPSATT